MSLFQHCRRQMSREQMGHSFEIGRSRDSLRRGIRCGGDRVKATVTKGRNMSNRKRRFPGCLGSVTQRVRQSPHSLIASVFKMLWNRGGELSIEKQDPHGSSLRWYLGSAFHHLAATQGIPVLEPIVIGNYRIDADCCSDGHDGQKNPHTRAFWEHRRSDAVKLSNCLHYYGIKTV